MTEFKMPPRDRSPGLMPSPRTEEPEYPTTITSLIVQIAALRGCVEKLEAERDAALARAEKAEARAALRTAERDRALEALRTIALAGRYDAFEPSVMAALANEPKEIEK